MEEDKKTIFTLGVFFTAIGAVTVLLIILAIYIQSIN